jgi:polar amino acid transport system substrate-binding protein
VCTRKSALVAAFLACITVLAACGSSSNKSSSSTAAPGGGATTTTAATTTSSSGACSSAQDAYIKTVGSVSDFKPVTADTLTVVTSLPGPGFWEGSDTDPTKVTHGYEYDVAKAMEQAFGLHKLVVENKPFDAIVAGQVTNYDLALSQISITCERAKVVEFGQPYFQSNQGILVKTGFKVPDLATAKSIRWGVQTSTTAVDLLKKIGATNVASYKDLPSGYTALQAGQIQAFLVDTAINLGEAARSNGALQVVAQFNQPGGPDLYGALLPKGSSNVGAINAEFKALTDSGKLDEFAKKDLTADPGNIPVITVG